jgi:ribosomal-protein-alanine N-acetyltransferase
MLTIDFTSFPILQTNRLLLREVKLEDATDFFIIRSNIDAMKFIDRPIAKTLEDAEELINKMIDLYSKNEGISWAICLKEDSKLIGTIGFWRIDKQNYRAEIGYILNPLFHRKGIMNEAMIPAIDYAFNELHIHSIEANINPENIASRKILEKNNFIQEAYFKENYYSNGKFLDSVIFSLLNNK